VLFFSGYKEEKLKNEKTSIQIMNYDYEMVKKALTERGIDVHESYIERALREYGFEEFPASGLEYAGLSKLVKTAVNIYHSEANLITRNPKCKDNLPVPKIKEKVGYWTQKRRDIMDSITTLGCGFLVPYNIRTFKEDQAMGDVPSVICFLGPVLGIVLLANNLTFCIEHKQYQAILLATTVGTNLASGIYEYIRHVRKKSRGIKIRKRPFQ
jgi:hypothetical protein